jgi:hypothetical protein
MRHSNATTAEEESREAQGEKQMFPEQFNSTIGGCCIRVF